MSTVLHPNYAPPQKGSPATESPRMARRWQSNLSRYANAGLCPRCAGQAAFGHQLGWANVFPPCSVCWPIVTSWANPTGSPSGWHVLEPV